MGTVGMLASAVCLDKDLMIILENYCGDDKEGTRRVLNESS